MVRPLAILAVLLAVAALVWFGSGLIAPGDVRPSDLTDRGTSPVPAAPEVAMDSAAAPAPDAGTEPGAATREVVSTGGASASLAVALRWSNDQSPAVGIPVQVRLGWDDTRIRIPSAVSDAAGNCLFEGLTPGEVRAAYGHGERRYTEPIALVAGGHAEVTIEVEVGLSIRGRVVDAASRPVPDATIVVAGWSGGRSDAAGRSGSDGSFALRGLPLNCHVGARKAGFVPSSMRSLTTSGEAEIELTIVLESGGGSLSGRVFGPDGEPVAGAQVRCGDTAQNNHTLPDGGSAMAPQPVTTRTDSDGRFAFEGLVPGSNPLGVRAEELAPHYEVVEIATGNPTEITVHLLRGATLRGVTKNEQGLPIAGAWISVHDREHRESRSARTLADGSYRLGGLRSGRLEAMARHTDHGVTNVEFEFAAGREQRWDPVLSAGLQQRGRVLDGNGDPVEGAIVEAQLDPWVRGNDWYGYVVTGADGRFVLKNCVPDHAIRLTVRTESVFPVAKMRGVATGREELVIRLPEAAWVWMTGTVVGPDGGLPANVQASPSLVGGNWGTPVETVDPNDGSFRFGPYPPGTYRLMFQADGLPRLRFERKLGADETWDLGTVRFPRGGHLAVQLLGSLALPAKLRLGITDPANGAALERVDLENGIGRSRPLAPGDYQLEVHGEGFASQIVPFSIRAEQETKLDVELAEGFAAKLTIELPAGRQRGGSIDLEVRDESGRLIRRLTASSSGKAPSQSLSLASGRYRVSASWQDCSATAGFEVGGRSAQTTTVLRLQPR